MENRVNQSIVAIKTAQVGQFVEFGRYQQAVDSELPNPIVWRVLGRNEKELFLLSAFILDCKRYHTDFVVTTYKDCSLRKWLGDVFLPSAFTSEEQSSILITRCSDNGEGSEDTFDKLFLLSIEEVRHMTTNVDRKTIGSEYAIALRSGDSRLYVYDKSKAVDYIERDGQPFGCSWWWLRTQPKGKERAAFVGTQGSIRSYGRVSLPYYGVRPALKLDLSIF